MSEDFWSKLDALYHKQCDRPANSFTCKEYAQRYGLSLNQAQNRLTRMAEAGKLASEKCIVDGRLMRVYFLEDNAAQKAGPRTQGAVSRTKKNRRPRG